MAYDASGNVLTVTDADNHTVTNVYDADNRLIQTTNGRGDVVKYTYDGPSGYGSPDVNGNTQLGLLSSKTDGNGHMTFYNYTARNEPAATYYADGISESVTYDAGGNTLTRTKADGKVIHYAYDKDNRLTDITYPALHATHFDYDAGGRKTHMSDATGDTTWTYGDGVHLTTQQTPQGTVGYAYDSDGRRTIMSLAGTTGDWYYGYDSIGSLLSLQSPADGVTHFAYDAANRLTQKTLGSSNYETYAYDAADQMTGIGYWWADGNLQNSLTYSYTPGGNVSVCNQGWYNTTYAYDGADQLVSETGGGTYAPPTYAYTYDHNGNRLTQSSNGTQVQSFTYDAHDKLSTGTFGNEREGYDKNGSETNNTLTGAVFTYDDEDRLVQAAYPGPGITDSFTYNGLGLRVGKTDSTGSYSYVCDGASPGSPVLSDGHAVYTPGLSERRDGVTTFDSFDRLGNLWTVDGTASQYNQSYYQDTTGFGSGQGMGIGGTDASPFKFGGGNGCQSDGDTGLVLMGHRYYDPRIGRFLSQDPAGDGDNWYSYADNNPVNHTDPSGLSMGLPGILGAPDQRYGGPFGDDPGRLFGGQSNLDDFWASEDAAMARGQAGYLAAEAALDAASKQRYYHHHAVNERQPGESDAHYFLRGLKWAIEQMITLHLAPSEGGYTPNNDKAARSLEKQIAKHEEKLQNYKNDPDAFDNDGRLRAAGDDAARRQSIIDGRIQHLQHEIDTFKDQIGRLRQ